MPVTALFTTSRVLTNAKSWPLTLCLKSSSAVLISLDLVFEQRTGSTDYKTQAIRSIACVSVKLLPDRYPEEASEELCDRSHRQWI